MPLEIRELVIKAAVSGDTSGRQGAGASDNDQDQEQAMIRKCVDAVLEVLRQRKER